MNSNPLAIHLENISFSFNGHPVLEEVTLDVREGDFLGVIGPNGSGKTTLLRVILGLLHPETGHVEVFGLPVRQARPMIGYVPQHAQMDRLFPVTVMDVVLMGRLARTRLFGGYSREDRRAAGEALQVVEMGDLSGRRISALSGGQRQRVLIARALAGSPRLLLLDEPTSSVDSRVEEGFYELLKKLNQTVTIVLVSHDLGFISAYVNRVACVNRRVAVHYTHEVTEDFLNQAYQRPVKMVKHVCEL